MMKANSHWVASKLIQDIELLLKTDLPKVVVLSNKVYNLLDTYDRDRVRRAIQDSDIHLIVGETVLL